MELADMRDLGSRAARRAGSSPVTRTTSEEANCTPLPPGRRKLRIRWLLLPFQIGGLTGGLRFGYGERFGFELPWYNSVRDHSARQENGDRFGGRRFPVCAPASNRSTEDRLRRRRAFETQMIDWNQHGFP